MMTYTITFMNKKGKVKGKVACHTDSTMIYLIENWKVNKKKGICVVTNHKTKEEKIYTK